jgi:hypothetical protein
MVVSAHADNRYFFTSQSMPSSIPLDGVTITPTNTNGQVKNRPRTIFNENVTDYARVLSNNATATQFTITANKPGVFLVYYSRSWENGSTVNDDKDLNINGKNGFAEYVEILNGLIEGVKYYVLDVGTYTMTAENVCGVYGFVYMSGNVAAYNPRGNIGCELFGQCCDNYANLSIIREDGWHFEGWYKDETCTEAVIKSETINEPTVLFASLSRCVWDFKSYTPQMLGNNATIMWDGIVIYGSDYAYSNPQYSRITDQNGLMLMQPGGINKDCVVFTPRYDGELTVTYKSTSISENGRICAVGTEVVTGSNIDVLKENSKVVACGYAGTGSWSTLQVKLKAGVTYYIYQATTGGIAISNMKYMASASSAVVSGDNVSLTTTANMQGWRAFYDNEYSYTVDDNTKVYMVVDSENNGDVKFCNKTGNKVPMGSAVVLHTDALQSDGTYLITMTRDETPYVYEGTDNLLMHSNEGEEINAYRLGYRSGEENGVAFYSWSTPNASAGIVYLYQPNNNGNAKIAFEIEESATGVTLVQNEQEKCDFVFNLNGQRLAAPRKGFNIINGKKYIVR